MSDQEKQQDKNTDESIEERVVNKLKKVITIKKELSDKQKAHIEKLGKQKKGKKYIEKVDETEVELPTEVVPKKPRAPRVKPVIIEESESDVSTEPEVIVVKKKKKRQVIIEESESEEEPVKKIATHKKKPVVKKPVVKKPVVKPIEKHVEEPQFISRFSKSLF